MTLTWEMRKALLIIAMLLSPNQSALNSQEFKSMSGLLSPRVLEAFARDSSEGQYTSEGGFHSTGLGSNGGSLGGSGGGGGGSYEGSNVIGGGYVGNKGAGGYGSTAVGYVNSRQGGALRNPNNLPFNLAGNPNLPLILAALVVAGIGVTVGVALFLAPFFLTTATGPAGPQGATGATGSPGPSTITTCASNVPATVGLFPIANAAGTIPGIANIAACQTICLNLLGTTCTGVSINPTATPPVCYIFNTPLTVTNGAAIGGLMSQLLSCTTTPTSG